MSSQYSTKAQTTTLPENLYIDTQEAIAKTNEIARTDGDPRQAGGGPLQNPTMLILDQHGRGEKRRSGMAALRAMHARLILLDRSRYCDNGDLDNELDRTDK